MCVCVCVRVCVCVCEMIKDAILVSQSINMQLYGWIILCKDPLIIYLRIGFFVSEWMSIYYLYNFDYI